MSRAPRTPPRHGPGPEPWPMTAVEAEQEVADLREALSKLRRTVANRIAVQGPRARSAEAEEAVRMLEDVRTELTRRILRCGAWSYRPTRAREEA